MSLETRPAATSQSAAAQNAKVVTKAALRAADRLGMTARAFAQVVGLSEATVSRMRAGDYLLRPGDKSFELALLFIRLYRSLDAIIGGDDRVAGAWLRSPNALLDEEPLKLIQTVPGLVNVLQYLDARRAVV